MTARAMSLHNLSTRESNVDVLGSSEELGACDLSMFLCMQASSGFKDETEMVKKATKKKRMMLMKVFIASCFSFCLCKDRKCIDIYIVINERFATCFALKKKFSLLC